MALYLLLPSGMGPRVEPGGTVISRALMSGPSAERATVRVRVISDPCVLGWCWEVVDPADGRVLESSWTHSWTIYDSSERAYAEGQRRLDALARNRLVIVAREEPELHDWLLRKLSGDPGITIVRDRRQGDRRASPTGLIAERRRGERRHRPDVDAELRARGWTLVRAVEKAA